MYKKLPILALLASLSLSGAAHAALVDRGGGLIYDTDLNVTWLQNANAALGSISDKADGIIDGRMTWYNAANWASGLNYYDSIRKVTYSDWRLPTWTDTGAPGTQCTYSGGTDCGNNVDPASSEMAHLYFTELGNLSYLTTSDTWSGAYDGGANPNSTLDNVGPFTNFQSDYYWLANGTAPMYFRTLIGYQGTNYLKTGYALAVRSGDVAAVPEADTWAMLLAGLGLVGAVTRRRLG